MKDLDKKSNNELMTIRKNLADDFEKVKHELVRLYDHWGDVEAAYHKVNNELKSRGIS